MQNNTDVKLPTRSQNWCLEALQTWMHFGRLTFHVIIYFIQSQ